MLKLITALAFSTTLFATSAFAQKAAVKNNSITQEEVLAAQQAWGKALVQISQDFEKGGIAKATETAKSVLDAAYGYDDGPVLFKPTLTSGAQTFRTTYEGALAYFVGNNSKFPQDSGFALKGWRKTEIKNSALYLNGDLAISMGNVMITNKDGQVTTVDKTWGYKKDTDGKIKIVLHHSSLPYSAK